MVNHGEIIKFRSLLGERIGQVVADPNKYIQFVSYISDGEWSMMLLLRGDIIRSNHPDDAKQFAVHLLKYKERE